ncbi:MAG: phosphonate C-P lyase system protein PhnG [Chloroflexota bacterium]|nr:phosphonate C-P lyase system protein PhnG [Chloroflexota bacterium]
MNRTQRCEMLARLSDSELAGVTHMIPVSSLADRVVVVEPSVGMVMARAIEGAHGEVFNVGEVLVTECQVRIDRREGWGMLMGSRPNAALAVATIDAAIVAGRLDVTTVDARLALLIATHDAAIAASQADLAATRVQFETQ